MKFGKKAVTTLGSIFTISGGVAYAEEPKTSFYGLIDVYAAAVKAEGAGTDNMSYAVNSSGFTTSFIGAKTEIDLGDGLKGETAIEGFLRPDTGKLGRFTGDDMFTRNAYIGLSGNFGSVKMGRLTTVYFISTIVTNPFGGSFGFGPSIKHSFLGGLKGDSGWDNAIQYDSPEFNGLKASLLYSAGEIASETETDKIGASLFYNMGKFSGTLSYQSVDAQADDPTAPKDDTQSATMIGVGYDLDYAKITAQYFMMNTDAVAGDVDYNTFQLGASIPYGKAQILASVAATTMEATTDTDRTTFAVAYDYFFTNKIDVYTVLYFNDVDAGTGVSAGLGGRVRF